MWRVACLTVNEHKTTHEYACEDDIWSIMQAIEQANARHPKATSMVLVLTKTKPRLTIVGGGHAHNAK